MGTHAQLLQRMGGIYAPVEHAGSDVGNQRGGAGMTAVTSKEPVPPQRAASAREAHPAIELASCYVAVFPAAWALRAELAGSKRLADEAAFLPASLQETPVYPAPRRA
jgi:hypothetical protein